MALQDEIGVSPEHFGEALRAVSEEDGANPLFAMERGEMSEADFLDGSATGSSRCSATGPHLHRFREVFLGTLHPNEEMIGLMRELREGGLRMAMLTNNVREWEPLWRAKLPVDEIFETVVDSAFVGCRKPEARIYEITRRAARAARRGLPLRRRHRGQLRGRPRVRPARGPLPRQRAGDRRDPRGARAETALRPRIAGRTGVFAGQCGRIAEVSRQRRAKGRRQLLGAIRPPISAGPP